MVTTNNQSSHVAEKPDLCCSPASNAIREQVRKTYGAAIKTSVSGGKPSCCGSKEAVLAGVDPITTNLYSVDEACAVPADALLASFGCGNPTALAELKDGDVVLDLGSGGGIDVLLSARRVAPNGKAYGLDMTPEMLELARRNQKTAGIINAEFLQGEIEAIPLPNGAIDVIISNCVINLSPDKDQAMREAYRVLRAGGRFAVSDIVLRRPLSAALRKSFELWAGCIAGALLETEYRQKLAAAGFVDIDVEITRVYTREDAQEMSRGMAGDAETHIDALDGAAMSAFIRARKA